MTAEADPTPQVGTERPVVLAGVAKTDITPARPAGMAGFVARMSRSTGVHDPLTARALCVDDSCLLTVDLCGVSESFCRRVAERCVVPSDAVLVHAIHTHSAAQAIPGHPAEEPDAEWLAAVEDACVRTIDRAHSLRRGARLLAGWGPPPGITRNRRRPDGPVDDSLPVLEVVTETGDPLAVLASYACHPVVLDAQNTQLSADYPGHLRRAVEAHRPGAVALFATGCAGDLNTGHSAHSSMSGHAAPSRTQAEARRIGTTLAASVAAAELSEVGGPTAAASTDLELVMDLDTATNLRRQASEWASERQATADLVRDKILGIWADWADGVAAIAADEPQQRPWPARVSALRWGDFHLIALPGEPFCAIGERIRAELPSGRVSMVLGYTGGYAGYLPTAEEYPLGGYEPCESHRYRGLPGPFTPGTDERLVAIAAATARSLDQPTDC